MRINLTQPLNTKHPLAKGLVAAYFGLPQWSGGNTWFDLCGKSNGTLTNGPVWVSESSGNRALSYDGFDDYVNVGSPPTLQFANTDPFSISFWMKASNLSFCCAVSYSATASGSAYYVYLDPNFSTTNGILFDYFAGGYRRISSTTNVIRTNEWFHVCATTDNSNTAAGMNIYVNGVRCTGATGGSGTVNSISYNPAIIFNIGGRNGTNYFSGILNKVMVYNRELPASEVAALYQETRSGCPRLFRPFKRKPTAIPVTTVSPTVEPVASKRVITRAPINLTHPLNKKHPLAAGLVSAYFGLTQLSGGNTWFDLCRRNNATVTPGAGGWTAGLPGSMALNCDGSATYAVTAAISATPSFSVSSLVWLPSAPTGSFARIAETHYGTWFYLGVTSNGASYSTYLNGTNVDGGTVVANQWTHVACTFSSASGVGTLYVDGVPVATNNTITSPSATSLPLYIGRFDAGASNYWTGRIEHVALYSRCLGAKEILALCQELKTGCPQLLNRVRRKYVAIPPSISTGTPISFFVSQL